MRRGGGHVEELDWLVRREAEWGSSEVVRKPAPVGFGLNAMVPGAFTEKTTSCMHQWLPLIQS